MCLSEGPLLGTSRNCQPLRGMSASDRGENRDPGRRQKKGTSKNIPLWCDDRRSSSQRGRSFNPWPLIEAA